MNGNAIPLASQSRTVYGRRVTDGSSVCLLAVEFRVAARDSGTSPTGEDNE